VERYVSLFIDYMRFEKNYSAHTVTSYANDLRQFLTFLDEAGIAEGALGSETVAAEGALGSEAVAAEGALGSEAVAAEGTVWDMESIDADIVRRWILLLMKQPYSATSVNRKLSALQSFFAYAVRQGFVRKNPLKLVNGPKKAKPLPYFIKEKDMNAVLDDEATGGCPADEDSDDTVFVPVRNQLMLEMFYETGIRCSELVGMKDVDVEPEAMILKVTGKRNKQRLIPFGERLKEMIVYYINVRAREVGEGSETFFVRKDGRPVTSAIAYYVVKKQLAAIPTLSKRSPHVLRHTFATSMLNNGASMSVVGSLLGHSSLAATSVYTHVTFEELKKVYNAHPRAKK
jgi:integrase/recombinase XerC